MAVDTTGMDRVLAGLTAAIDRGVFRAAGHVTALAVQLAPEDTGDLKRSGRLEPSSPNGGASYAVVFAMPYARAVEYGTSNPTYPAQPYLTPAVREIDVRAEVAAEVAALIASARR